MVQDSMDLCINRFYDSKNKTLINIYDKNFNCPIISHGQSHSNHTHYMIVIQICQNDTIINNNSCESLEYIYNYLNQYQIDSVIGILNQEIDVGIFSSNDS